MRNRKHLVLALIAALVATVAGVLAGMRAYNREVPARAVADNAIERLFAAALLDANGRTQPLAQWRGKPLVINFWATWCPPCREEMPAFSRLQTKHEAKGVQFVGIALDSAENVGKFAKEYPVVYPLLIGGAEGTELNRVLGNTAMALPYTVVLRAGGAVDFTRLGRVSEQELDAVLQRINTR